MIFKKTKPVTTVADAIAPFRQVKDNLTAVLTQHAERQKVAAKRIADARDYARQVEADEKAAHEAAAAEIASAQKVADALSTLLGEDKAEA